MRCVSVPLVMRLSSFGSYIHWTRCSSSNESSVSSPNNIDKKIEEMAEFYSQLTLRELNQLQRRIFEKLGHSNEFYEQALLRGLGGGGVSIAAGSTTSVGANSTASNPDPPSSETKTPSAPAKKAEEKLIYDLRMTQYPPAVKIKLIKEIRSIINLPLGEAKAAIEKCPGVIASNVSKADAEKIKQIFEALGATIELI